VFGEDSVEGVDMRVGQRGIYIHIYTPIPIYIHIHIVVYIHTYILYTIGIAAKVSSEKIRSKV